MTTTAEVHTAVTTMWNNSSLNNEFKSYWPESKRNQYSALHDKEAGPQTPFPYCVFEQSAGNTSQKMSGTSSGENRREIRVTEWSFRVEARRFDASGKTPKLVASELVDEIMKVFGGHPTVSPSVAPALTNGAILQITYLNDVGVQEGDDEYAWMIRYRFEVDTPVAA